MTELGRREFLKDSVLAIGSAAFLPRVETGLEFYFQKTGHHLRESFLDAWRRNRNGHIFGLPITEAGKDKDGVDIQYFENVRLEQDPQTGEVRLGKLGLELKGPGVPDLVGDVPLREIRSFWRKYPASFGRLTSPWIQERWLQGFSQATQDTENVGIMQKLPGMPDFFRAYRDALGLDTLWPGEVQLQPLGLEMVRRAAINTDRVPQRPLATTFTPRLFEDKKRIDVNLSSQELTAFEGEMPVMIATVSTGKPTYPTPQGNFRVIYKKVEMDYTSPIPGISYNESNVPFNMMFREDGIYIHGAYWHDEFGRTARFGRSYGCVNMDMYDAAWLYDWVPMTAPVKVHY